MVDTTTGEHLRGRTRLQIFGVLLAVIGAVLTTGGFQLVTLAGSWYYLLVGVGFVFSGVLFTLRHIGGAWLFALLLAVTIL
jgi:quinoprotein glucose dehydrogenase